MSGEIEGERANRPQAANRGGDSVLDYGDPRAEYDALRNGVGLVDLAHYGTIRIEGRDRVAWLHKLVTANVESMPEGSGTYALLLNAKGHVAADFIILVQKDALVLYTTVPAKTKLLDRLRRAMFREKVTLTDVSDSLRVLSLQGPRVDKVIGEWESGDAGASNDDRATSFLPWSVLDLAGIQVTLVHYPRTDTGGMDLLVSSADCATLWDALVERGARPVGLAALNTVRIEAGIAWYGVDFDEDMLAPEARLEPYIAENKGCYTGQEVIARIQHRGHVNRLLTRFRVEGERVPERGDLILFEDREVGWVTSAAWSIAEGTPLALGYLRIEAAQAGTDVQIGSSQARFKAKVIGP